MASNQAFIVALPLIARVGLLYSRAPPIREHYAFFGIDSASLSSFYCMLLTSRPKEQNRSLSLKFDITEHQEPLQT